MIAFVKFSKDSMTWTIILLPFCTGFIATSLYNVIVNCIDVNQD